MWSEEEEEFLIKNYPNNTDVWISKKLNRSIGSVRSKSFKMGLRKSKSHKSKMISKRNKMVGRDLTFDLLKEIALNYKTRSQFQKQDPSAYSSAQKSGRLDDICSHMIPKVYSLPQLICRYIFDKLLDEKPIYNTRKIISPYEIDIYYPNIKLGIEYNGKGWHNRNDNTLKKIKMCEKKGILLIVLVENNRNYEKDIKNQIIKKLKIINDFLSVRFTKGEILSISLDDSIYDNIIDEDEMLDITSQYDDYSDFINNERTLYCKLLKLGKIKKYTQHMKRKRVYWNLDKVKSVVSKFEFLNDLIEEEYGCYLYIKKNKLESIITDLKYKNPNDKRNFKND